jgi:hypothetical protein
VPTVAVWKGMNLNESVVKSSGTLIRGETLMEDLSFYVLAQVKKSNWDFQPRNTDIFLRATKLP